MYSHANLIQLLNKLKSTMKSLRSSSYRQKTSSPLWSPPPSSSLTIKLLFAFFFLAIGFGLGIIKGHHIKSSTVSRSSSSSSSSLNLPAVPPVKKAKPMIEALTGFKRYMKPTDIMHDISDGELFWKASMVPRIKKLPYHWFPKIAFLFLTKGEIPLAPLWDKFFKGHGGLYSIYVHSDPLFNGSVPVESVFYGRRIRSKKTRWGHVNMLDAERRLLANALLDFTNERFILLSESHIPLFNFSTVYSYLMGPTIYIESYNNMPGPTGRTRYTKKMGPVIRPEHWHKGSQWFDMDRKLALEVISDEKYYPEFRKHCKLCVAHEHYLPTMLNINRWRNVENRSLTWMSWSKNEYQPAKFSGDDVTIEFLKKLRHGRSCNYNGMQTRVCFLFARKFLPNCLGRLLELSPIILGFG